MVGRKQDVAQGQPNFHILPDRISNDRVRLAPIAARHQAIEMHKFFIRMPFGLEAGDDIKKRGR